mmetsp:Transcript_40605/g.98734  ORF Transcript_40605/g.98734 Transcript_40605/m.98734 type:complete len:213 (+) Transcript_40605:2348-2986(+)
MAHTTLKHAIHATCTLPLTIRWSISARFHRQLRGAAVFPSLLSARLSTSSIRFLATSTASSRIFSKAASCGFSLSPRSARLRYSITLGPKGPSQASRIDILRHAIRLSLVSASSMYACCTSACTAPSRYLTRAKMLSTFAESADRSSTSTIVIRFVLLKSISICHASALRCRLVSRFPLLRLHHSTIRSAARTASWCLAASLWSTKSALSSL